MFTMRTSLDTINVREKSTMDIDNIRHKTQNE